ncbi:MAG TPA: ankyrin repeat domain-containing protein [Candidatus Saccharimonadales bacterium]|nr:ankyrin repeat domain-containing protein [Candidatus Saccharimonadales bacterium]
MNEELFAAINAGDLTRLRTILDADPRAAGSRNGNGVSAVLAAAYRNDPKAVAALRSTGLALDLFEAAAVGDVERVRDLLSTGATRATDYNTDGFHALGLAAFFRHFEVLKVLLDSGADVQAPSQNQMRVTALHSAVADRGDREIALALIAAGADPNAKQRHGWTPLHGAAGSGDRAVIGALLTAGADPTLANDDGKRAADIAREAGHADIADLLDETEQMDKPDQL